MTALAIMLDAPQSAIYWNIRRKRLISAVVGSINDEPQFCRTSLVEGLSTTHFKQLRQDGAPHSIQNLMPQRFRMAVQRALRPPLSGDSQLAVYLAQNRSRYGDG
jgi:hypothetical protein